MGSSIGKITVFGAGSIGCYLGGLLLHAGANIQFIGRERFQKDLTQHGLSLSHYQRQMLTLRSDKICFDTTPDRIGDADIVLVTVKSQDTKEAGHTLAKYLNSSALVISFQNGVSNADQLRQVMPGFSVLGAVVPFNVTGAGPGKFHCGTEGDLCIENDGSARLDQLKELFVQSGQGCNLSDNISAVQWGKLLVNLNNALNTLSGGNLYAGLLQRDYRRALALMIEEALMIVSSAGIEPEKFGAASPNSMIKILRLPNLLYRLIMNSVVKIDANARSSMLDDLEAGRDSEIEYLQGEIVRLADISGQSAPINKAILDAVNAAFRLGESPRLTGHQLLSLVTKNS